MADNSNFKVSSKFTQARTLWKTVNDLWGGTSKMREASTTYLPKFTEEEKSNYDVRLTNTTLFNVYKKTIQTNVGKVFSKQITVEDGSNEQQLVDFSDDVDGTGQTITQFSKKLLENTINHGVSYLLIDYPVKPANATYRDDLEATPYWIKIEAPQVLEVRKAKINGVYKLSYFRFLEEVPDEYQSDIVSESLLDATTAQQVKVFFTDATGDINWQIWRKDKSGAEVMIQDGIINGQVDIPIVPFYSNRIDFFMGQPVLMDLAEMNIQHWQSSSDQRNILRIARVPMLQVKGYKTEYDSTGGSLNKIVISPNTVLEFPDTVSAGASWIEHTGASIDAGRQDLQDIEAHMAALGLELQTSNTNGTETATARIIDQAESNSLLKDITISFKMSLEKALEFTLIYLGHKPDALGDVTMNTEIQSPLRGIEDLSQLFDLYKLRQITAETLLKESVRRNLLSLDTDVEQELKKVEEEKAKADPVINNITINNNDEVE